MIAVQQKVLLECFCLEEQVAANFRPQECQVVSQGALKRFRRVPTRAICRMQTEV